MVNASAKKNLSCWKRHTYGEEGHLSDVMLLSAILGVVSVTARILYQHPIQWSDGSANDLGSSTRSEIGHSVETPW